MRNLLLLLVSALLGLGPTARADELDYRAADPAAAAITAESLAASERFWPYQASLTRAWTPPGASKALWERMRGVLVRVEDGGHARIDFGRDGVHVVPVDATDLLEGANLVRQGRRRKDAPNYVWAVGKQMIDPATGQAVGLERVAHEPAFLNVFADPAEPGFEALVKALAPLEGRNGVKTVFFPQGPHPDGEIGRRLHALGWRGYLVYDHFSEGFTEGLLAGPYPAATLTTPEGRELAAAPWEATAAPALEKAIDASLGGSGTVAARP